jgi:hypothetical protein
MELTYDQMIPTKYQEELIQLGEQVSNSYWRVGDIANVCYTEGMKSNLPVTKMDIQAAVGFFFRVSGRTVRYYADVAGFYPYGECCECGGQMVDPPEPEQDRCNPGHWCYYCEEPTLDWREKYVDVLSFQHYAYAMQFRAGDKWKQVLEDAAYGGHTESPLSVDVIAGKNRPPEPEPPDHFPEVEPVGQRPEISREVAVLRAARDVAVSLERMSENPDLTERVRDHFRAAMGFVKLALFEMSAGDEPEVGQGLEGSEFTL